MSKIDTMDALNDMIGSTVKNERINTAEALSGINPAALSPTILKETEQDQGKHKNGKQKTNEDNLKRLTFWGDEGQWDWIANYAYTTRQTVKDVMYQIIEDFQSAHNDIDLSNRPIRRTRRNKKK